MGTALRRCRCRSTPYLCPVFWTLRWIENGCRLPSVATPSARNIRSATVVFFAYDLLFTTRIVPAVRSKVTSVSASSRTSRLLSLSPRLPMPASGQVTRPGKKWMPRALYAIRYLR
jgi:hypothetical protein